MLPASAPSLVVPAPLWRRLAAGVYDLLLFLGVLFPVIFLHLRLQEALGLPQSTMATRGVIFITGLAFFGWFWTHGGQTLGMRAWRLQVRRDDGTRLRWREVLPRYAVAWIFVGLLWCLVDVRKRAWHDMASGCEVVVVPR
jgi:uncharacterized RDD family membrane protein YckC